MLLSLYTNLQARWATLRYREDGATAVEYGLIVALIAAVIITIVTTLGTDIEAAFKKITDKI